jgi:hypothetical protein
MLADPARSERLGALEATTIGYRGEMVALRAPAHADVLFLSRGEFAGTHGVSGLRLRGVAHRWLDHLRSMTFGSQKVSHIRKRARISMLSSQRIAFDTTNAMMTTMTNHCSHSEKIMTLSSSVRCLLT